MAFGPSYRDIPPVTRNLIILNVLIWAVELIFPSFSQTIVKTLGLHFIGADLFNPAQILTYMFVHDSRSVLHIFFNMFTLWMFGPLLERVWGSRRFLVFYFICGIGAAILQEGVWALTWRNEYVEAIAKLNGLTYESMEGFVNEAVANHNTEILSGMAEWKSSMVTIGASGAIFGLLLGFAFVFPNLPMYIFFIPIPIKAKYMVAGYAVLEFFLGVSGSMSTVAHFAHLGGMLFGLVPLLIWKKKGTLGGGTFY
ncbi:MAG: rhomboid family intramembrane serine protease [Muribaculaceae bacterium]|nr:rhomboid family intramembrane serine protease [Muribaculaceae bacterium]